MSLGIKKYKKVNFVLSLVALIIIISWFKPPLIIEASPLKNPILSMPIDSPEVDLKYPFSDNIGGPNSSNSGGLYLNNPKNIKSGFEYDPETGTYNYYEKIGDKDFKYPTYMNFDEYLEYDSKQSLQDYWKQKSEVEDINQTSGFKPIIISKNAGIFGDGPIEIVPQGSAEISFGINRSTRDNPALPVNQRSTTTFDFNQQVQLNVVGNIGSKMSLALSYNTEATFDFENLTKITYEGEEDEIIQLIEAGNVSLPLKSSLITGSQTLFGIKTALRFGRMDVTTVLSQERGERKEINIQGGAQIQDFEKEVSDYEENKHYFLSHFFRDNYESSLSTLPIISSRATITKIEVWVSNANNAVENTKNIIGFMDLGEATSNNIFNDPLIFDLNTNANATNPDNDANSLYPNLTANPSNPLYDTAAIRGFVESSQALERIGFRNGTDFERYENARLLQPTEFNLNTQLGYISLNSTLNADDILAVAFQYTLNGEVFQVGEFSTDGISGQNSLYVKLLRGTNINTSLPIWDLMMKNVYSLGAFNIAPTDFFFDVFYLNPETGVEIPFIPEEELEGVPIINVLNLDRLNTTNQANPDGVFDFIDGVTINASTGRVFFPVLEPFGSHLRNVFSDPQVADQYAFDSLYASPQTLAEQDVSQNRFTFRGQYSSSSSSDIRLNSFNIPQGSVVVTAGGATLTENVDYTVDYNLGTVKIINDGILQSGTPIKISLESQSLFNIQTKTFLGSRFDYKFSDDFNVGGTILRLSERPLTRKINIGDEPINNTIWGLDVTYTKEVPLITRWIDKLPIYSTKEKSTVTLEGEFAHLIPGNPSAITDEGVAYLDDFEGSQSTINLTSIFRWKLASTPQEQPDLFPEGVLPLSDSLAFGFNRARTAWYVIDPLFWRNDSRTPDHISNNPDLQSNHYSREILQTEVFPQRSPDNGIVTNIPTLDLAYYPTERGMYNFDDGSLPAIASGINASGELNNPTTRWGGIMRDIQTTDFESSNVEFIQFWVMDPFDAIDGDPNHPGGQLYFNLGNISEDVLKDGRKSFENGLPITAEVINVDTTVWGRVPTVQALVNTFDNTPSTRVFQDVGMDGLNNVEEAAFFPNFNNFLDPLGNLDPSGDNYHHFRGSVYDARELNILERYKLFNGMEGNSPSSDQFTESFSTSATTQPDIEDLNQNNNLDFRESYFQYVINLNPNEVNPNNVGNNFIRDVIQVTPTLPNGDTKTVRWYQFKIPIREPQKVVGDITDFKSIRFMRMFLKGFNKEVVLRFATLDLVRGEWRKYTEDLLSPGDNIGTDNDQTTLNIGAVNVEENSEKTPVNYIIPPGIDREINPNPSTGTSLQQLNEQSLVLDVCNLNDGDARAGFKALDIDIRRYKRLRMFIHAEESNPTIPLNDGDLSVFVRMGTDFDNNYYEYEIPLTVTPAGSYSTDNNNNTSDRLIVWPEENDLDLEFSKLTDAKRLRNSLLADPSSGVQIIKAFENPDGNNVIRVKGNPNLAEVRVFMIGVRNSKQNPLTLDDDGLTKCAEIWVNELRMSDFDNEGGWATKGRLTTQLADLGNVTVAGDYSTPGFGSLDQKLNERQQETRKSYDFSTSAELGKFIPEKIGISVPIYYGVSKQIVTPRYNPLDPDLELNDILNDDAFSQQARDSIGERTQEVTARKSINFTNVRKLPAKGKKKNHFYDISNLSFNYGYTEYDFRDFNTEIDNRKTWKGGFAYAFNSTPKNYKPFNKMGFAKKKSFQLLKDFNFSLAPKQLSFQTDVDRAYSTRRSRNNTNTPFEILPYYQKHFYWNRIYGLKYDITKSLKFDFNATNNAIINEPLTFDGQPTRGRVDRDFPEEYNDWQDTVIQSFKEFGINTHYHHNFNVNYRLPINKIPYLGFTNITARYSGDFDWQRAPIGADSLGHILQNSNTTSLNGQLNMTKLYNDVGFLKKVQKRTRERQRLREQKKKKPNPNKTPAENAKVRGWKDGVPPPDIKFETKEFKDSDTTKIELWKKKEPFYPLDPFWNLMMSPKNISGTYTVNRGTLLPGYNQETEILGFNPDFNAPGFNFVAGVQEEDFALNAAEENLLVNSAFLYNYNTTYSENYNIRATLRPIKSLRIQLNVTRNYSTNINQQFFEVDEDFVPSNNGERRGDYFFVDPVETGNFSMSFISIRTAFSNDDELTRSSSVFDQFLGERAAISQRLGESNDNSVGQSTSGFRNGYGETSQDVLIPAFIAGYSNRSGEDVSLKDFDQYIPLPNWRITYDGLSKIDLIAKALKRFSLTHSYRSTFNVSSFTSNLEFEEDNNGDAIAEDLNGNFIPELQIATVSISEQFSPLIGADMTLQNNMIIKVEYRQDRNASLSLANNQITEVKGSEWIIGTGYKFRQVRFPFIERTIRSDVDTRIDISIRNNNTIIRRIIEEVNQLTSGQRVFSIKFSADYRISQRLNIRAFYDYIATTPFISTTFPTSNTNAGFTLRFSLSQ